MTKSKAVPVGKRWTVARVLAEKPCLGEATIRQHFGTKRSLTIREILVVELRALLDA